MSGLPFSGSWQDIKDHCRDAGEVVYADVFRDGTGVVEFARKDDMRWAIDNLDNTSFRSHEVCIKETPSSFLVKKLSHWNILMIFFFFFNFILKVLQFIYFYNKITMKFGTLLVHRLGTYKIYFRAITNKLTPEF